MFAFNNTLINNMFINASIYCGIKLKYIGLGKCYNFLFTNTAKIIVTATAAAKA